MILVKCCIKHIPTDVCVIVRFCVGIQHLRGKDVSRRTLFLMVVDQQQCALKLMWIWWQLRSERCVIHQLVNSKLLNISWTSVNHILIENLAMQRVLLVWIPHFLTNAQVNDRIAAYQENLGLIEDILNFLVHVISCDKSLVHYFDPKSKQESSHWKSPDSPQKKETAPAEIGMEGAHGVFFDNQRPIYQHVVLKKVKIVAACCNGIFKWRSRRWSISESCILITLDRPSPKSWKLGWPATKLT